MTRKSRLIIAAVTVVALLGACASAELAERRFEGESMRLIVRTVPGARVRADYDFFFDPDDPVGTIISIGTSVAKATQVEAARRKMDAALAELDIATILEEEVGDYFTAVMEMRITESRTRATYAMNVEVDEYGISASGPGSNVEFVLNGSAELYDAGTGDRIWRERFRRSEDVSPSFFGLPPAAGNVFSAAMLADLTEEEIAIGIERVTRDAAWEVAEEFERDLYRARRRR